MQGKKFYVFILLLSLAGYSWLIYNFRISQPEHAFDVCLFKKITGVPCPSCGTTHSVVSIFHGMFLVALHYNPIGYIVAIMLIIIPPWIITDLISGKETFFKFYKKTELVIRKKWIAIPSVLLILTIWILNIFNKL
jgi:hypothetical protein